MNDLYIGSGDTSSLLMGKDTEGYFNLFKKFISNDREHYNAKASPINALRAGAILEEKYFETLDDSYYSQHKVVCKEKDVLCCSLDFAKINNGIVVDFDELKTCNFNDFLNFEQFRKDDSGIVEYLKKNYKNNYNQVQQQLLCTELESANIVFLVVYSYDDEENYNRVIKDNEYIKFRITRDESVISKILERAEIFQTIKDNFKK